MRHKLLKIISCAVPIVAYGPVAATEAVEESAAQVMPGQLPKNTSTERAMMAGDRVEDNSEEVTGTEKVQDKEEIWSEISSAIASLNEVVGDKMFLDLHRKNDSQMEVRVDQNFWKRVRYQTRVDLKKDISNIWHLYVKQYHGGGFSAVHFVDDTTDKTIDIFTQSK